MSTSEQPVAMPILSSVDDARPRHLSPGHSERQKEADRKLAEMFADAQPKLVSDQEPAPKPTRLTELDKLRLENISLKLMNIGQQFEKLAAERAKFSRQFDELRRECVERYGVDITTTRIDEDGNFCGPLARP